MSINVTRVPAASAFASLQRKSKVQHPSWVMSFSHCSIRSSCQSPDIKLCHIHMNFRPKRSGCCWHFHFGSQHGMSHPRPRPSRIVLVRPLGNVRSQVDSSSIIQSMVVFHLKSPWNSHKKFMSSYYQLPGAILGVSTVSTPNCRCLCLSGQSLCLNALSIIFLWLHLGNHPTRWPGGLLWPIMQGNFKSTSKKIPRFVVDSNGHGVYIVVHFVDIILKKW